MDSKARAIVNRQNSLASTGPKTQAGKDKSKYNSLKHALSAHRPLDMEGIGDKQALADLRKHYEDEYEPETLAENIVILSMIEHQWQLSRVRRMLDLAFIRGGDLMTTSKMIDNYSRHQTRLDRAYSVDEKRLDQLMAQRQPEPDSGDQPAIEEANPETSGFVSQKTGEPAQKNDVPVSINAAPPIIPLSPTAPHKSAGSDPDTPANSNNASQINKIGFVLKKPAA